MSRNKMRRTHSNRALTRALRSMKKNNEDNETTEVHPLVLIAGVLIAIYVIARMFGKGVKLPGISHAGKKPELPGE